MKRLGNFYNKLLDLDRIKASIKKTSKTRKHRPDVAAALKNIDNFALQVLERLKNRDFRLGKIIERDIVEGTNKKHRHIAYLASFLPQCMMSVLFDFLAPYLTQRSYRYSYGSIPGRGVHELARRVAIKFKQKTVETKYAIHMDIHHCFQNVDHNIAKKACRRFIKDKDALRFIDIIIDSYPKGLPIGFLSSPWIVHIMLLNMDHLISKDLSITFYARFMDDILITGPNKRKLLRSALEIERKLHTINFSLKTVPEVISIDKTKLDYVGFVYNRTGRNRVHIRLRSNMINKILYYYDEVVSSQNLLFLPAFVCYIGWLIIAKTSRFMLLYIYGSMQKACSIISYLTKEFLYANLQNLRHFDATKI